MAIGRQRMRRGTMAFLALTGAVLIAPAVQAAPTVHVFAAASTTDAMNAAIAAYESDHETDVVPVYASSSTLARQIAHGAPADIYLSANRHWMDWLAGRAPIEQRAVLLRNRLALIASSTSHLSAFPVGSDERTIASLLKPGERLALGNPAHVPAGMYAKEALKSLGEWQALQGRLASASDVRAALAWVARGEAPIGIVYQTDAFASDKVVLLGLFPADSHTPIAYPVAVVNPRVSEAAIAFRQWLATDQAGDIFASFGFAPAD